MPVTTRIQAEAEGITDEDMVSLENPPQPETGAEDVQQTESHDVDETGSCHPVFYLSDDIPVEVWLYDTLYIQNQLSHTLVLLSASSTHDTEQPLA